MNLRIQQIFVTIDIYQLDQEILKFTNPWIYNFSLNRELKWIHSASDEIYQQW
jgi:hypothetical protein